MATDRVDNPVVADQHTMDEKHDNHTDVNQNNGNGDLVVEGEETAAPPYEHNEAIHGKQHTFVGLKGTKLGMLVSVIATTGFLLFGYDQGVMSGIIAAKPFNDYFPETYKQSVYQGFVTAIYEIGCLAGALGALVWGDTLGRRKMVSISSSLHSRGASLTMFSDYGWRYHYGFRCPYPGHCYEGPQGHRAIHYRPYHYRSRKWNGKQL